MKSPSKAALRRAKREAQTAAQDKAALDYWFEVSGTTLPEIEAAIDRWPCIARDTSIRLPGCHPEVITPVMEHPRLNGRAKLLIIFAMQRIAAARHIPAAREPTQVELFGGAP